MTGPKTGDDISVPEDVTPLAPSQETLWDFMKYFSPQDPGRMQYNVATIRSVEGPLRSSAFHRALADVTARHDALRVVFADTTHDPLIRFLPDIAPPVSFSDLSKLPADDREKRARDVIGAERSRAFDLLRGPLWHVHLLRLAEDHHVLAVFFSHIIADDWSVDVFVDDLLAAYRAHVEGTSAPPPPATTFREVAAARPEAGAAQREYWRDHLTPLSPGVLFPVRPDTGEDRNAAAWHPFSFGELVAGDLTRLAWQLRTTPFVVLLTAFHVLLAHRSGLSRVVVGTTTHGRETGEARRLVGQFTTNVYVATATAPDESFRETVARTDAGLRSAIEHRGSFKQMARAVDPDFARQRPWPFLRLYHAWFQSVRPQHPPAREAAGLVVRDASSLLWEVPAAEPAPQDSGSPEMWIKRGAPSIVVGQDRRHGWMTYNPSFFHPDMVAEFVDCYTRLVERAVGRPEQAVGDIAGRAAGARPE
jgi:hypothetical protein